MKKRSRAMAVAALVLCISFAGTVSAQENLLEINFTDGYTAGAELAGQQGWTQGAGSAVTNWMVEDDLLRSHPDATGGQFIYLEFPVQQGIVTATWEWQYEGDGTVGSNTGFGLMDTANIELDNDGQIDFNELSTLCRMATGITDVPDTIDARYGDLVGGIDFRALTPVPYMDGTKITVRMVVDVSNQTYDVYAQREGEAEVQLADDFPFRRAVSQTNGGLNAVVLFDDLSNASGPSITVDNIRVSAGSSSAASGWEFFQ
ncbi:MAG: hypothetical protein ACOX5R_21170 [bacterium]